MIDMISNVPITNIEELQSMNDALATATTDINDLNDNSQVFVLNDSSYLSPSSRSYIMIYS